MMLWNFRRFALSASAVALLAGCGASQPPLGAPNRTNNVGRFASHRRTFHFTGKAQSFKVPAGVTRITVKASGASGPTGGKLYYCNYTGGNGGIVTATISVTPGETLAIYVGGEGIGDGANCAPGFAGGFNGGGDGGSGPSGANGTGGGGASDVRQDGDALSNRVIVAGGGAGGGIANLFYGAGFGGAGGGKVGATGGGFGSASGYGGTGGTQRHGGKGGEGGTRYGKPGAQGHRGKLGVGGAGGSGDENNAGGGGGGGGGYYGGGGGGAGSEATSGIGGGGGGGGGSSYIERGAMNVKNEQGAAPPGNGVIVISW